MDVPFSASGAMSRAQYALVRKVESAPSPQLADQFLLAEIDAIHERLSASAPHITQCKESLIMLLYCSMSVSASAGTDLDFALPHAVNLAEAGKTTQDKRIGYLFCMEAMPPDHELQLMLVNTLRKDLESPSIPRICLALDTLIQFAFRDVIPAVQARLYELLSHTSPHVRRRSLLAFKTLSEYEPEILKQIAQKVSKRLSDPEISVVSAALAASTAIVERGYSDRNASTRVVYRLLKSVWQAREGIAVHGLLLKVLNTLRSAQLPVDDLRTVLEILQNSLHKATLGYSLTYQCFLALESSSTESIVEAQNGSGTQLVRIVCPLLTLEDPNAIYTFVSCLDHVDIRLWAGTTPEVPVVLEEWEVEKVMKLLDSDDRAIRMKTVRILHRVDPGIVETYRTQILNGENASGMHDTDEIARRLFEIVDVVTGEDGETYVINMKNILHSLEDTGPVEKRQILAGAVEEILLHVRLASSSFRDGFIGALSAFLDEPDSRIGPSLIVILCALVSEHLITFPMSPSKILESLSMRIDVYPASIQDACLLCIIRVMAECETVPGEVVDRVRKLHDHSGRHIRRRCDQFLHFSRSLETLKHMFGKLPSYTLPDILIALEAHDITNSPPLIRSPPLKPARSPELSSRNSPTPSKLRYDAYEAPKPVPRLRRLSSSSRNSDDSSSRFVGQSRRSEDSLTRTLTPGDLTLAAGERDLRPLGSAIQPNQPLPTVQTLREDELASRIDLITLDSPFIDESPVSLIAAISAEPDFETTWNSLESFNTRGWCEANVDTVLRRLQGLQWNSKVIPADQSPFQGEIKLYIAHDAQRLTSVESLALLRLKQSEDGCLWRLRSSDDRLRTSLKAQLAEI